MVLRTRSPRFHFLSATTAALAAPAFLRYARAAQFELKGATNLAADHPTSIRQKEMWAAIDQESGGRTSTQFFPNSSLGTNLGMLSQVRVGAIQFFILSPGILQAVVPSADISEVHYVFKDEEEGLRVMDGPLGEILQRDIAARGMYGMRKMWASGMRHVISGTHPIRTVADFAGFKLRVLESRLEIDFFKTVGASPTALSFNETYTALQTKLVEGADLPLTTTETSRMYEVTKYLSLTGHDWSGLMTVVNGDFWKSLPPDLQALIERNNDRHAASQRREIAVQNAAMVDKLTSQGLIVNKVDPSSFRAGLKSYYQRWAATFGPQAWGALEKSVGRQLG